VSPFRLLDKVAIITGGARSIGKAVAVKYAEEGASIVIADRNGDEAKAAARQIAEQGGKAVAVQVDVSNEDEVGNLVKAAVDRFGTLDILVNNAGIDPRKKWLDITGDEWDLVMGVNVKSQFLCARAAFPYLSNSRDGNGKIINVSSVVFFLGQPNYVHYVASKGAVIGFTRALAREVGNNGINVNCITPGAVYTESELEKIGQQGVDDFTDYIKGMQCFGRRQFTDDILGAFVFLASADSDFITGQTLNVDGGWVMH